MLTRHLLHESVDSPLAPWKCVDSLPWSRRDVVVAVLDHRFLVACAGASETGARLHAGHLIFVSLEFVSLCSSGCVDTRIEQRNTTVDGPRSANGMKMRQWWCSRGDAWIRYASLFKDTFTLEEVARKAGWGRGQFRSTFSQAMESDENFGTAIWTLSGRRLLYFCLERQECPVDASVKEFLRQFPGSQPPSSSALNNLSRHREEHDLEVGKRAGGA